MPDSWKSFEPVWNYLTTNWWIAFAFGGVLLVLGWKMTASWANFIVTLSWIVFLIALSRAPIISAQPAIPRALWTMFFSSLLGLAFYATLWTPEAPATANPPNSSASGPGQGGGLTLREVPPARLGFSTTIPESFTIEFGTNRFTFPTKRLQQQVPFNEIIRFAIPGELPFKIYFDERSEMKIDATVYDASRRIAAVVKNNDFSVINLGWDRNWDSTAFEIVDEQRRPVFQIDRVQWNFLKVRGRFMSSGGMVFVSTDSGLVLNPNRPTPAPKPLFQYPSAANLSKRVQSSQR